MPAPPGSADLTGAIRYRETLFGRKLILEVEVRSVSGYESRLSPGVRTPVVTTSWRDAESKDLLTLDYLARKEHAKANSLPPPPPPGHLYRM